jgi:hypothetical protein
MNQKLINEIIKITKVSNISTSNITTKSGQLTKKFIEEFKAKILYNILSNWNNMKKSIVEESLDIVENEIYKFQNALEKLKTDPIKNNKIIKQMENLLKKWNNMKKFIDKI